PSGLRVTDWKIAPATANAAPARAATPSRGKRLVKSAHSCWRVPLPASTPGSSLSGMPSWPTVSVTIAETSVRPSSARLTSTGRERTTTASHGRSAPSCSTRSWATGLAPVVGAALTRPPARGASSSDRRARRAPSSGGIRQPSPSSRGLRRLSPSSDRPAHVPPSAPPQPDPPSPHRGDEERRADEGRHRTDHELARARDHAAHHNGSDHEHGTEHGA